MQLTLLPLFFILKLPLLLAAPVSDAEPPFAYERLTFIFAGGPASYTFTFPADGNTYPTSIFPFPRATLHPHPPKLALTTLQITISPSLSLLRAFSPPTTNATSTHPTMQPSYLLACRLRVATLLSGRRNRLRVWRVWLREQVGSVCLIIVGLFPFGENICLFWEMGREREGRAES
jgi:hypothetical protein